MSRPEPPDYDVQEPAVYIAPSDPAWDWSRISAEENATAEQFAGKPDDEIPEHPVRAYFLGRTRMRLGRAADYLDPDKTPVRWRLCEMPIDRFYEARSLIRRASSDAAQDDGTADRLDAMASLLCVRYGVEGCEGGPSIQRAGAALSDAQMRQIRAHNPDLIPLLGVAAWRVNQEITAAEGKH
jgi:hypothetical protein